MQGQPNSLDDHRVRTDSPDDVWIGEVRWSPAKSLWFLGMASAALVGGIAWFSWSAFALFLVTTASVLLFGHSLGSHRKLIHDSYQCPRWLERVLIYCGVQVGLAGPLGLLEQHELRDYAQRLPRCHDYLRHGRGFWRDAWWQLNCELRLAHPPRITLEPRLANDRYLQFLERSWMLQQLPPALLFYAIGGWGWVFWGVCARVTAGVFGHWLIGYFAHNHGGMHYKVDGAAVQGRNIPFAWALTMGECWHNNHHAYPGSARLGLFPGEWDPGWWVLMAFRRLGWAWQIRLPQDLAARPELVALDAAARGIPAATPRSASTFVRWPGALAGSPLLRTLFGPSIELIHDPSVRRLTLTRGSHVSHGLPALCIGMRPHGGLWALAALALWPFASAFERTRTSWDMA